MSIDEAVFRQAECLRLMGEESVVADSAEVWFTEALALYGEVGSYLASEALFWQGTIYQALRESAAALAQFEQVVAGEAAPELACRAPVADCPLAPRAERRALRTDFGRMCG